MQTQSSHSQNYLLAVFVAIFSTVHVFTVHLISNLRRTALFTSCLFNPFHWPIAICSVYGCVSVFCLQQPLSDVCVCLSFLFVCVYYHESADDVCCRLLHSLCLPIGSHVVSLLDWSCAFVSIRFVLFHFVCASHDITSPLCCLQSLCKCRVRQSVLGRCGAEGSCAPCIYLDALINEHVVDVCKFVAHSSCIPARRVAAVMIMLF